jgi:adenylate cyclase
VRELPLHEGENLLGREPEAVVRLVSEKASRRHARIVVDDRGAVLEDLGSKNGTRVNGTRVGASVLLAPGDRIEIGRELLVFCQAMGTTRTDVE